MLKIIYNQFYHLKKHFTMKKLHDENDGLKELSRDELRSISGGGITSFVLGYTIFGFARLCGVMTGYATL
jgi:hypothetical protein